MKRREEINKERKRQEKGKITIYRASDSREGGKHNGSWRGDKSQREGSGRQKKRKKEE